MPAAFDEREREAIKERLIESALDALRRGGLGAANIAGLAASAAIAKGSFYAFYPSKEHLFMDALESIEDRYRERFAASASGQGTPVERLERAFMAAFELMDSEPALGSVDAATMERLARALPPDRIERHAARDIESVVQLTRDWRQSGLLAAGTDPDELAAAGYAVFLVSAGLKNLPAALRSATEAVVIRGLARALAGWPESEGAVSGDATKGASS